MGKTFQVKVEGEVKSYPEDTKYQEIAEEFQEKYDQDILLVQVNGKLRELYHRIETEGEITFVTAKDSAGYMTYSRSLSLLMIKAVYDVLGKEKGNQVQIHYHLSNGLYCTIPGLKQVPEELLCQIKNRMLQLAEKDIPIKKESWNTDVAISKFHQWGMYDKEKLLGYRRVSSVNMYNIEDFSDYFYGYMVPATGYLKVFDLSVYKEGFVLVLPSQKNPKELADFIPRDKLFKVLKESSDWGYLQGIGTVGDLNDMVTAGGAQEVALVQEAMQEKKIAEIATKIAENPKIKFILIAGPSSSGKTTFSHRLSIQLRANGLHPHPIAVDNYFKEREDTPKDEKGEYNFECLEAVDVELFNKQMQELLEGKEVVIPSFNFKIGKKEYTGRPKKLGAEDILVIEGIHCLNPELTKSLSDENKFKIYISALTQINVDEHNRIPTTDGRLIRRIVRDARTRGTSAEHTIHMWPSVRKGEEEYIFPYQEEADIMFNSALIYELAVLKPYVEADLFGIGKNSPEYKEAKRLLKFLDYFVGISSENVPSNSLLREFIGGGCFNV